MNVVSALHYLSSFALFYLSYFFPAVSLLSLLYLSLSLPITLPHATHSFLYLIHSFTSTFFHFLSFLFFCHSFTFTPFLFLLLSFSPLLFLHCFPFSFLALFLHSLSFSFLPLHYFTLTLPSRSSSCYVIRCIVKHLEA